MFEKLLIAFVFFFFTLCCGARAQSDARPTESDVVPQNASTSYDIARSVSSVMTVIQDQSWTATTIPELFGLCTGVAPSEALRQAPDDSTTLTRDLVQFLHINLPKQSTDGQAWSTACVDRVLKNLSPRARIYSKQEYDGWIQSPARRFAGIGVSVARRSGAWTIVEIVRGSSSERAGLRAGDVLLSIDGVVVEHLRADDIQALFRRINQSESSVRWEWRSPLDGVVRNEVVERTPIAPDTGVDVISMEDHTFIRISRLNSGVPVALLAGLRAPELRWNKPVVFDLRDNSGGLFDVAAWIAVVFAHTSTSRNWPPGKYRNAERNRAYSLFDFLQQADALKLPVPTEQELTEWRKPKRWVILVDEKTGAGAIWLAEVLRQTIQAQLLGVSTDTSPTGIDKTVVVSASSALHAIQLEVGKMVLPDGTLLGDSGLLPDAFARPPSNALKLRPKSAAMWKADPLFDATMQRIR